MRTILKTTIQCPLALVLLLSGSVFAQAPEGEAGGDAVRAAIEVLKNPGTEEKRDSARESLIRSGDAAVWKLLTAADKTGGQFYFNDVAFILEKIGQPSWVHLLRALKHDNPHVRRCAATAIWRVDRHAAVLPLVELLKDSFDDVRACAARALAQFKAQAAYEPLLSSMNDPYSQVRMWAANALWRYPDPRTKNALIRALKDKKGSVLFATARSLGLLGDKDVVFALVDFFNCTEPMSGYSIWKPAQEKKKS